MNKAFNAFDTFLIQVFQWAIRQLELYTNATKKDILKALVSLYFWEIVIFSAIVTGLFIESLRSSSEISLHMFVNLFTFILVPLSIYAWRRLKEVVNSFQEIPDTLPVAVVERKEARLVVVAMNLNMLMILSMMMIYILQHQIIPQENFRILENTVKQFYPNFIGIVMASFLSFLHFLFEYLFCTSSLPPGEKENGKKDRESTMLTPAEN